MPSLAGKKNDVFGYPCIAIPWNWLTCLSCVFSTSASIDMEHSCVTIIRDNLVSSCIGRFLPSTRSSCLGAYGCELTR